MSEILLNSVFLIMVSVVNVWLLPGSRSGGSSGSIVAVTYMMAWTPPGVILLHPFSWQSYVFILGTLLIVTAPSWSQGTLHMLQVWVVSSYLEALTSLQDNQVWEQNLTKNLQPQHVHDQWSPLGSSSPLIPQIFKRLVSIQTRIMCPGRTQW